MHWAPLTTSYLLIVRLVPMPRTRIPCTHAGGA